MTRHYLPGACRRQGTIDMWCDLTPHTQRAWTRKISSSLLAPQMFHPCAIDAVAKALYDGLADGPICFSRSTDEQLGLGTLALPRPEGIEVWRRVQETPLRTG
jgi:hypothetical protein